MKDKSHLQILLDTFTLTSPTGSNTVLVFPVRGSNLRYGLGDLLIEHRMKGAKQLLQALQSLLDADSVVRDKSRFLQSSSPSI